MENALSQISQLPLTKMEQEDYARKAIDEILSGIYDPLRIDMQLKAMEEVIKKIREDHRVRGAVIDEADKYGKTFPLHGVRIEVKNRTTRDFAGIDPTLDDLYAQSEQLKAVIKAREAVVLAGVDPVTGETFDPPKTSTTTFLTYKF